MLGRIKLDRFLVLVLLLIFLLALGVRISLIIISPGVAPSYGMITPMGDAARNLVEGRGYVVDGAYTSSIISLIDKEHILIDIQDVPPPPDEKFTPYYALPPGTSILLAGTYWIFGQYRYIYLRYVQAIIDSFGCLLIFWVGKELFSRRVGLISAFLYAIWLPIAYLSTWPLHDALIPFITLVCLYFFVMGVRRKAIKFYVLSGLFAGIGCYFQPTILFLPLFFGLGLLIYNLHKSNFREQVADVAKATIITMLMVVLVITPWIVRNYHVTGSVIVMRPGPWSTMWEGFGESGQNPVGAQLSDEATYELARKELGYNIEYLSPAYQAFFKPKVLNALKEYPGWYLCMVAKRIPIAIFIPSELGIQNLTFIKADYTVWLKYLFDTGPPGYMTPIKNMFQGMRDGTFWAMFRYHPYGSFYLLFVWIFAIIPPLISIFALWAARRNWRLLVLVATVPVYFISIHIFTMVANYKSIVPGSLGYIIFSAITLDYIYCRIKGRAIVGSEPAVS